MRLERKYNFDDVLIVPRRSKVKSRKEVNLTVNYAFNNGQTYSGIPIMAANMDGVGELDMGHALGELGLFTCLKKNIKLPKGDAPIIFPENTVAISAGISNSDFNNLLYVNQRINTKFLNLDVANGYMDQFIEFVEKMRHLFPNKVLIAGNVVTYEGARDLFTAGADIVKVGIGPGSVCATKEKTGVSYPQLSAIAECAGAAADQGGGRYVIGDGGCQTPGDIAKAFAAGADFVMLGGMFAGHSDGMGTGDGYKVWFSGTSMANGNETYKTTEAKSVMVPLKGPVVPTVRDMLGGLRSACSYTGFDQLQDFIGSPKLVAVR